MEKIGIVSTAWLAEHLTDPDLVVLDGSYYLPAMKRDADAEYAAAHIPGALRFDIDVVKDASSPLPHMLPSPEAFAQAAGGMGIGRDTLVIAYDGAGLLSAPRVAWTFRTFGSTRVAILDGGFPAWLAEGRPTESGPARTRSPVEYRPAFDAGAVADLERVRRALASGEAQVVDARPAGRFSGEDPEPRQELGSGHMPGALSLPSSAVITGGRLAEADAIRAAFAEAGVDPERPIVTTCGSGVTAVILTLALERIGRPAGAVYDGSWSEWAARDDTAIKRGPANAG